MSRKREKKSPKVPRKVRVRRSITKKHRNKYAEFSKLKHCSIGVFIEHE